MSNYCKHYRLQSSESKEPEFRADFIENKRKYSVNLYQGNKFIQKFTEQQFSLFVSQNEFEEVFLNEEENI